MPKNLTTHLTNVYTTYQKDSVISIPVDGQKTSIGAAFGPPDGRKFANVATNQIISEDSLNQCLQHSD